MCATPKRAPGKGTTLMGASILGSQINQTSPQEIFAIKLVEDTL